MLSTIAGDHKYYTLRVCSIVHTSVCTIKASSEQAASAVCNLENLLE